MKGREAHNLLRGIAKGRVWTLCVLVTKDKGSGCLLSITLRGKNIYPCISCCRALARANGAHFAKKFCSTSHTTMDFQGMSASRKLRRRYAEELSSCSTLLIRQGVQGLEEEEKGLMRP